MKTINLPGVKKPVSQVCLGTAYLGSREDEKTSFEIMDAYFERGGRFLNTAHEYGRGRSEQVIGKWLRERGVRDEIVLTSKCGEDVTRPNYCAMRPEELFEDIDETLSRTGLDHVDFYLLHLDDPTVPVGEIVDAMHEIRSRGKALYCGCSNWSCERITEARAWADKYGRSPFVMDEIEMNLADLNPGCDFKWMDEETARFHTGTNMAIGAYSSICNGLLTKYLKTGDTRMWSERQIRVYGNERTFERARRVGKIAAETGFTPTQVQLAWVLAQPHGLPCFPIVGARRVEQLRDSLGALDCTLTRDMVDYLMLRDE